jgi:hypothetical protein
MKFTLSVIHHRTVKLSPIVRLQDHWWTNYHKDLQQGNGDAGCSLGHYWNAEEELHSVVNIIEEKAERSIRHALKIYQVNLTSRSKTMRDDGLQPCDWSITQLSLYADGAQDREHFTENVANIVYLFANWSIQYSPLRVIFPVRPSDIIESMLKICYPLHKVDVNCLLSDDFWWPCNDHGTVSIDNHSKRLIPLIYLWIFTPQFSNRLVAFTIT